MLGYRLITGEPLFWTRSACPRCKAQIAWYDLIPIISYLALNGKCRTCARSISPLYPFIELIMALSGITLYYCAPGQYFPLSFLFFSALIVTIRSDLETMLISRVVTTYLVPIAIGGAYYNLLPISAIESIGGWLLGWVFLTGVQYLFKKVTHKDGLGDGDIDLVAMIGAFTGPVGCWISILIGSICGIIAAGALYLYSSIPEDRRMPFGPFLAMGAIIWVLAYFLFTYDFLIL